MEFPGTQTVSGGVLLSMDATALLLLKTLMARSSEVVDTLLALITAKAIAGLARVGTRSAIRGERMNCTASSVPKNFVNVKKFFGACRRAMKAEHVEAASWMGGLRSDAGPPTSPACSR